MDPDELAAMTLAARRPDPADRAVVRKFLCGEGWNGPAMS